MNNEKEIIFFDKTQSVAASIASDAVTFGFLALCIWISQGSKWWTFFTAVLFIFYLAAKFAGALNERQKKFHSYADLIAYAERKRRET